MARLPDERLLLLSRQRLRLRLLRLQRLLGCLVQLLGLAMPAWRQERGLSIWTLFLRAAGGARGRGCL